MRLRAITVGLPHCASAWELSHNAAGGVIMFPKLAVNPTAARELRGQKKASLQSQVPGHTGASMSASKSRWKAFS